MTFNFKKQWRTTTALCIASTIAVTTAAYAANYGGRSDWDRRPHHNHHMDNDNNGHHDNNGHDDHGGGNNDPAH
jgi:phospholipase C